MISRKQLEEIAATVRGVPVWGCLPGSTAAEAGVRYGDIVIGVNGVPTPTIDEYLEARKLRFAANTRVFGSLRRGGIVELPARGAAWLAAPPAFRPPRRGTTCRRLLLRTSRRGARARW